MPVPCTVQRGGSTFKSPLRLPACLCSAVPWLATSASHTARSCAALHQRSQLMPSTPESLLARPGILTQQPTPGAALQQ